MDAFGIALDLGVPGQALATRMDDLAPVLDAAAPAGLGSVWFGEEYGAPGHRTQGFHTSSPLLVIARLSTRTDLHFGTGATLLRAWEPARLAYDVSVLNAMVPGRLSIGLALGPDTLRDRFGRREWGRAEIDAAVARLRAWWGDGGDVGVEPSCLPIARHPAPRLYVGGGVRAACRRAARHGDGFYLSSGYHPDRIRALVDWYREELSTAGTPVRRPTVIANRIAVLAPTTEEARRIAAGPVGAMVRKYRRSGTPSGRLSAGYGEAEPWGGIAIVGDPAGARRDLERLFRLGVTRVNFRVAPHGLSVEHARRTVDLLGREVLEWATEWLEGGPRGVAHT